MSRVAVSPALPRRRLALGAVRALLAVVVVVAGGVPASAAAPRYRTKPGVRLSPEVKAKLGEISERYYKATKRTLLITSGNRSPREQAEAMYGKLRAGDRLWVYRDQRSVGPIRDAYDTGRKRRWKKARIIAAMTDHIAGQVARGVYISRHLRAHAFDVRCYDLTRKQKAAFRAAADAVGGVRVIEERRPPHFHCEVRLPRKADDPPETDEDVEDGEESADTPADCGPDGKADPAPRDGTDARTTAPAGADAGAGAAR